MREHRRALALAALVVAMLAYCAANLRLGTDVTRFLPIGSRSELAVLSSRLTDSPLTRTIVISLGADETATAIAAARDLADALGDHPEVAWLRSALDDTDLEALYAIYFPRRHDFLSDDPEREIPKRTTPAALEARARGVLERLASPAGTFFETLVPADPLGGFEALALRLRAGESMLDVEEGQLVTPDRRFAILILGTRGSAFDSGAQGALLDDLRERFEEVAERRGGGLFMEISAVGAFAVAAEQSIKRDVYVIAACSFVGVALLFMTFVASLRGFLIVSLPPLVGIVVATTVALLVFGNLDGLTMAFGASLMGIAIDYSNHLLIHRGLADPPESPWQTARRLRPTLGLGALTTVASFVGLGVTAFPAFREMGLFAITGVLAALAVSLLVLPELLGHAPPLPSRAGRTAKRLGALFQRVERMPRTLLLAPLGLAIAALPLLPELEWIDDISQLNRFDPELVAEDRRVRERVARLEGSRFVIALAPDAESALARNDEIHARLERVVAQDGLGGIRSLHGVLWSAELQRRNREALERERDLAARLDAAFARQGFRPGAFRKFAQDLAEPPESFLTLDDLRASPVADLLTPFVFDLGDQVAVVTYLRELRDEAAVRDAIADLDGVHLLDQRSFVNEIYREFRITTLRQIAVGGLLVISLLALRYRAWRPVAAAFLPSAASGVLVLGVLALAGIQANLLHVMSLVMVMGMGVDYGVFCVDSAERRDDLGATLLSLLLSCLTTAFVFGTLGFSSQPSLQAIGLTTGLGVILCYALAPLGLIAAGLSKGSADAS